MIFLMSIHQSKYTSRSLKGIFLLLGIPILLIESGAGCAEIKTNLLVRAGEAGHHLLRIPLVFVSPEVQAEAEAKADADGAADAS